VAACEPPIAGIETHCDFVEAPRGYRLRTVLTRPRAAGTARLPAILFVQWLSCDPVTLPATGGDGWAQLLRGLIVRSGVVVARTEKAGLGESGGPACTELGYDEELEGHEAALAALRRSAHVHPDSIYVFGASMGGTMAPLLARRGGIRGVMVWGTTTKTWAEHMIALDRRVLELRGVPPARVHDALGAHTLLHALYLADARPPTEIVAARPALAATWERMLGTDSTHRRQYGRPIQFHQEAQRANWEGAWAEVDAPVLVVRGEYDWIMAHDEHARIVDIVRARGAGRARFVTRARTDHGFLTFASLRHAFAGSGGTFDAAVIDLFTGWIRDQRSRADRSGRRR
jgi:pimeloyl-ACP methyl ester carboxylesterase